MTIVPESLAAHAGLLIERATVRYGGTVAAGEITLDVAPGETVALVGPSGCGKSTTLRAVAGLVPLSEGRIAIRGLDVTRAAPPSRGVGLVPQNYALFPHMSVAANIAYGMRARRVPATKRQRTVDGLLELTSLGHLADRRPDQLSGGQRQRVALARALAVEPSVLLLDEPMAALDPQLRGGLRRELAELLRAADSATLLVTHDQREALALGQRIAVLREGRIVQFGTARELWNDPADALVADFLAGSRLLDAHLDGEHAVLFDGRWRVPLDGLVKRTSAHGRTRVLMRPESLMIVGDAPRDQTALDAEVTHTEFVGEALHITLEAAGTVLTIRTPADVGVPRHVRVAVRPGHASLLIGSPN
ncbi:ABC transporter ATP-binding protein [Sinomonas sp. ASV322]|uniref:ABC transporter ATP-binding protein n=1 Tax=Sinomonas sp. ASV322 TaxID=3041920 RepID=UPI0027DE96D5|nr:ABC transporter ATP-binding protein [Sinomonas sp. ASV322]MDQ4501041.1 ABC transporter ATP-binding protein [Sinomonas sp. ASV322]